MAVAFLTTMVKAPDEDDWAMLTTVLKYLKETISLTLTLEIEKLGLITRYVGASYTVHEDCKGHRGAHHDDWQGRCDEFLKKTKD